MGSTSKSARVRDRLDHPVVDGDGHIIEHYPILFEYLSDEGGVGYVERFLASMPGPFRDLRELDGAPSGLRAGSAFPQENTLDRATATLPKLFYERLGDDIAMDVSIVYPSMGVPFPHFWDEDLRRVACRAFNRYVVDEYGPYTDRIVPVGVVPANTPDEAIDELEHAVNVLGLKTVMIPGYIARTIPAVERRDADLAKYVPCYDFYGSDRLGEKLSEDYPYDYDRLWAKIVELKVVPAQHSIYFANNHVPNWGFIGVAEPLATALVMSGVTERFPQMNFLFQENSVAWACQMYSGLYERWCKYSRGGGDKFDPDRLNTGALVELVRRFGGERFDNKSTEDITTEFRMIPGGSGVGAMPDAYVRTGIKTDEDWISHFTRPFYFGCEADDPMVAFAFSAAIPVSGRLNVTLGSDVGHFDVPDMSAVVAEAYDLVERGLVDEEQFRDFTFANIVRCHGRVNPDFWKGTVVETEAAAVLEGETSAVDA